MTLASKKKYNKFSLLPYIKLMRLHQPTGIWLLLWPSWWSIALASNNILNNVDLFILYLIGAIVMRSAGCVINDILDRNIDPNVKRTKTRPIASGEISVKQASILLFMLLAISFGILLTLNYLTIILGAIFAVMVIIYPLMKRFIKIPQLFLGATINAGAIMGWVSVTGELSMSAWLLYASCFFWTLGYDTIYAHQDKLDDSKIGVQSAALIFGKNTKIHVTIYYLLMVGLLALIGFFNQQTWLYYIFIITACICLMWQILTVNLDDHNDCMGKFRSNGMFGWIVYIGIITSGVIQ